MSIRLKPKSPARILFAFFALFIATASFSFTNNLTKQVNGQDASVERIEEGSKLFKAKCSACHVLDNKLIGPGLAGVVDKYDGDYEWIISWITNNEKLRASGDARANAIYDEFNGAAMNTFEDLSEDQITSILMWVENGGDGDAPAAAVVEEAPVETSTSVFNNVNLTLVALGLLIFVVLVLIIGILELVGNITGRQILNWNNINAFMMLLFVVVFFALVIYEYSIHSQYLLPQSASEHGVGLDKMMRMTFGATIPVFFVTQFLLFFFSFKYRAKKGRKAFYYPHNNNLEYIWTFLPALVLTILVLNGLKTWKKIMRTAPGDEVAQIEVFAFQFGWQARYPGADNELGKADYNLISSSNPLGVANVDYAKGLISELRAEVEQIKSRIERLSEEEGALRATLGGRVGDDRKAHLKKIDEYSSGSVLKDLELTIRARETQIDRIQRSVDAATTAGFYNGKGDDDQVVSEIHMIKDRPITLNFRARDVIHSAYLPYFRTQMNVVPGLPTRFTLTPTISTEEMRAIKEDPEFDYYLVCNKICGNAHFNMKMKVVVEDEASYNAWIAEQSALFAADEAVEDMGPDPEEATEEGQQETEITEDAIAQN